MGTSQKAAPLGVLVSSTKTIYTVLLEMLAEKDVLNVTSYYITS